MTKRTPEDEAIMERMRQLTERVKKGDKSAERELVDYAFKHMQGMARELAVRMIEDTTRPEHDEGNGYMNIDIPSILMKATSWVLEKNRHPGVILHAMFELGFAAGHADAKRYGCSGVEPLDRDRKEEPKAFVDGTNSPN
jgi:hypothetical protein